MYGKLYSLCGYSQSAETSNTHFLSPNDSNYYMPEQFYEQADHIKELDIKHPQQLKFGEQANSEFHPFKFEDERCKSCGTKESYVSMQGAKKYNSGSKTVVNCTSCYSGEGKHAIPVTSVDSSDTRLVNEIYNNPGSCNNPSSTLANPKNPPFSSNYGWGKSRWNKIKENYKAQEEECGLDKKVWGPSGWNLIHAITFALTNPISKEKQQKLQLFFQSLHGTLPCKYCEKHCGDYVNKHPPPVHDAEKMKYWAWKFHDKVNKRLGKKDGWDWEKTKAYYTKKENICS